MTHATQLLQLLAKISPEGRCDDCLSAELRIEPRQTVNQACRALHNEARIRRGRATCSRCGKLKLVNRDRASEQQQGMANREPAPTPPVPQAAPTVLLDIEKARTEVVHVCHEVWRQSHGSAPPHSISVVINQLRNDGFIPKLQANMMLTICGLRNVHVYDRQVLSDKELSIASNALALIRDWWRGARGSDG